MTGDQIDTFLREPRVADLATIRPDGSPHLAPVWYHYDGERVMVIASRTAVKTRNIRNDPRVALSIATEAAPYEYVLVTGTASVSDDAAPDLLRTMAEHYKGVTEGRRYADQVLNDADFITITVTPSRISGWRDGD